MEEFVPPDVLAMLQPRIDPETAAGVSSPHHRAGSSPSIRYNDASEDSEGYVDLLKNVYQDQHALNYAQKEHVATKVLKGEYKVSQKYESAGTDSHQYDPFQHQAHSNANLRRHKLNHRMFELTSRPAAFHAADPVVKKAAAFSRNKEIGRGQQHFVSLGSAVPVVPLHIPTRKEKQKVDFPSKTEIITQQIISDASKVKQFRNTVGDQKSEYTRQKKREIEIKKKMAAFKEKLYKRLREKHDPQLSNIMRTLDDSVIFNFIESYKGCTMSIDAILMHIGANISPSTHATDANMLELAAPEINSRKISDANGYRLMPRDLKSKGAGFRQTSRPIRKGDYMVDDRPQSPSMHSVGALHQQMSAERLLPSMQPEKAITDDDLQRLGARTASCDDLRRSQRPLGKVEVATRRPPRSLKTRSPQRTGQNAVATVPAPPALSSTNYGGMYVISSYKDGTMT